MTYFYLNAAHQPVGPFTMDQLGAFRRDGIISDSTSVAPEGGQHWIPFSALLGAVEAGLQPTPRKKSGLFYAAIGILALLMVLMLAAGVGAFVWFGSHAPDDSKKPAKIAASKVHPLAEWYLFGHQQGLEAARSHEDLGLTLRPERQQITILLKNMGVDLRSLSPEGVNLCYQGYVDAIEGKSEAYKTPAGSGKSILPEDLLPASDARDAAMPTRKPLSVEK